MTPRENELLTRVTGDAPMGLLLRDNYWIPFARSESLPPGGAPQRVRLLGLDLVAFRGEDGTPGLMDEACPHRRASLALARVEGCSLRCIYHGWRMGAEGNVVEVPSEGERSDQFAARVAVSRRRVREGGGLLWAFLGAGEPPALPPLPFMAVPEESRWWCRMFVPCNWLQGFEGALDSVHLNWLHRGWEKEDGAEQFLTGAPVYEIEETRYGLRTAAIRKPGGGRQHFRVAEFIAPFYAFSASRQPVIPSDCSVFISAPVDDTTHMLLFGFWDEAGPLTDMSKYFAGLDPDNLVTGERSAANAWGQDRMAMEAGHFSGFPQSVLHEDVGVQMSMGPIVDRSRETLCGTDLAIMRMRRFLLDILRRQDAGEPVDGALAAYAEGGFLPFSYEAEAGADWREGGARKVREVV
jgi:phenylpropionate dioxygenase-like ring-hydroxylating dioxygenase large terminal subunit